MDGDARRRRSTPLRVACVGDNCIDVYETVPGRSSVGGNAFNVAVDMVGAGVLAEYVGEVGSDAEGRWVLEAATDMGVGISRVHVVAGRTWVAHISVGAAGAARVVWEDPGACGPYALRDGDLEFLAGFDHVHLANMADPGAVIQALRRAGVSTSYDYGRSWPAAGEVLPRIVFASADGPGAQEASIARARGACADGAELAIIMLGPSGSVADDGRHLEVQPARHIQPVDTLGAGDRYIAEFLAGFLDDMPLAQAMERAGAGASETCLHWAAWPQALRNSGVGAADS